MTDNTQKSQISISVVVPCLNAGQFIGQALGALLAQEFTGSYEIVVADNGSSDNTRSIVKEMQQTHANIRLVDAADHRGAAHARNSGASAAQGRAILFTDADDEVSPGWLQAMGDALNEHDLVGCGFDTQSLNEPWQSESWANGQNGELNNFHPPFLPWSGAGALGVLRAKHLEVGGFDETLLVLEDADYCWRIQLTGIAMHFVKATNIRYRFPKKYSHMYKQMRRLGQYHALLYRRYVDRGMPRLHQPRPVASIYRTWKGWLQRAYRAKTRVEKARLVRDLGWNVGRLYGSIRYRVMDL
ncbi:MAG: glycosyltransferase [Pseudomonadota bacterium]|nr:glycosyltransferase [Pseudomonadota bacterium]